VTREEIAALLFNVSDIARSLARIEGLLGGDDGEEEADEGDLEARRLMLENAERTRRLAEQGQAELERRKQRDA
jgi:hypothetical protein